MSMMDDGALPDLADNCDLCGKPFLMCSCDEICDLCGDPEFLCACDPPQPELSPDGKENHL